MNTKCILRVLLQFTLYQYLYSIVGCYFVKILVPINHMITLQGTAACGRLHDIFGLLKLI